MSRPPAETAGRVRVSGRGLPPELAALLDAPRRAPAPKAAERAAGFQPPPASPDAARSAPGDPETRPAARGARWRARLLPAVVRALGPTLRYEIENLEALRAARRGSPDGRVVYCCWHGALLPLLYLARGRGLRIVVSRHRDGEVAARVAARLGCRTIRGSTGRGGAAALLRTLRGGEPYDLALTPDGPRGPRGRFQAGAVFLAARSGLPLVLVGCHADRGWRFSSWDRFLLPAPFARVRVVLADPFFVRAHAAGEVRGRLREAAEQALAAATRAAEREWP